MKFVNVLLDRAASDFILEKYNVSLFPEIIISTNVSELAYRPHLNEKEWLIARPTTAIKMYTSIPFLHEGRVYLWNVMRGYEKPKSEDNQTAINKCRDMLRYEIRQVYIHGKIDDINLVGFVGMRVFEPLDKYCVGYKYEEIDNVGLLLENL